jgi:cytochrome oxidase Cu insertion factor (SCO1/SenC/PrrC family)
MSATLVSAMFCLCLLLMAAKGDEPKISLDHSFALSDADGRTVTSADFPGEWLLIYFGYTHCFDQCPTALSAMAIPTLPFNLPTASSSCLNGYPQQ